MATLTGNISATQTVIPVSGSAPQTGSYFIVDSEAVKFLGTSRGPQGRSFFRDYWSIDRGVAGTTAATHSNGAALTQYYPDAAGGVGDSGVTVDNGTDPPAAVTTLVAPGAVIAGEQATLAALSFQLIGPVRVNVGDSGAKILNSQGPGAGGVEIADIPDGSVVDAWIAGPGWVSPGGGLTTILGYVGVGSLAVWDTVGPLNGWDLMSPSGGQTVISEYFAPGGLFEAQRGVRAVADGDQTLIAGYQTNNDGTPSSGYFDVYVIIAAPTP
jgi:hypothetical protein